MVAFQLPVSGMSLPPRLFRHSLRAPPTLAGFVLCLCASALTPCAAAGSGGYRQPPQDVVAIIAARKPPLISVAPDRRQAILAEPEGFTRLEDLARPAVSVDGRRFDLGSHARRGMVHYSGLTLLALGTGESRRLPLADNARIGYPQWSPRSDRLAFGVFAPTGVELWHAGTEDMQPVKVEGLRLNTAGGRSFVWMPDGQRILCRLVAAGADGMPRLPLSIPGPIVLEATGSRQPAAMRAVGRNPHEHQLFNYFMRSQLAIANTSTGELAPIGVPDLYGDIAPSPDGNFILVTRMTPPGDAPDVGLSPADTLEVWTASGQIVSSLLSSPEAVSTEARKRRGFRWQHTASATLQWIEDMFPSDGLRAGTGGERLMVLAAPFSAAPREVFRSEHAITGIDWVDASESAIVHVYDEQERRAAAWLVDLRRPGAEARSLWTRHIDDRYDDPGRPMTKRNAAGLDVVIQEHGDIYMSARGVTPQGERPFVSRWSLTEMDGEVLWRSSEGTYAEAIALLDDEEPRLLIRHEAATMPPNYAVVGLRGGPRRELTSFRSPGAETFRVRKEVVTFPRADGIMLQATLYSPMQKADEERLPLVLWAYPRTYADAQRAGQVSRSGDHFSAFDRAIPAFLAMHGFAVMDQVSMPIVRADRGAGRSFSEQVVASARAAIDKAVEMGVADPQRVGVAGHSFGAFMTVSLLAHSELFKAGVAFSGAYNRTLTPFGFQTERRTLWEAPNMYMEMSPLMYAHRITAPLLLVHGSQDENRGTTPMQSERLFQAIMGQGGTAKLVMLPYEGHVYRARESVLHSAAEMLEWFSLHLRRGATMATSAKTAVSG
jgi:dipeptidyl aminopeptidase/acylaminoacyl peptidase